MRSAAGALLAAWFVATACSTNQPSVASAGRVTGPSGSPLAPASGGLDAEVAMPPGFPADFPIYSHARLTAAAQFASNGQVSWGTEWQTLDAEAKVQAFYTKQLNQGDWSLTFKSEGSNGFAGTITRKSNNRVEGTIAANMDAPPVTKILVSLVYPT